MALDKQGNFSQQPSELPDVPSPSMTPDQIRAKWQTPLDEFKTTFNNAIDKLNSTTDGASGADNVGATGFDGTPSTPQAMLEDLNTRKAEKGGDWSGTWQGYTPSKADPGISSVVEQHTAQLADLSSQSDSWMIATLPFGTSLTPLKGDGSDETDNIKAIIDYASQHLPFKLIFPKGTFSYTDLGNIAYEGLTIEGAGEYLTILRCENTSPNHDAILMNAFKNNLSTDQFIYKCNIKNIQVQGNENTDNIFNLQGIAHVHWENVIANSANNGTGKAYNFMGVMTSVFINVSTSSGLADNSPIPHIGLFMTEGIRGETSCGSSTNNTFIQCYFESVAIGVDLHLADQNTFIGGSAEACTDKGVWVEQALCRWNTFIGFAMENNTNYDIHDLGRSSQFINNYSASPASRFEGQQSKVDGGYFSSIQAFGTANVFEDLRVNMHGSDQGGFSDNGIGTYWKNIYDSSSTVNNYIYPFRPRTSIVVGASPFTWVNTTGHFVEVIAQTGTLSQVQITRSGQGTWLGNIGIPNKWMIAPNDSIQFTYSVTPGLSYNVLNGF